MFDKLKEMFSSFDAVSIITLTGSFLTENMFAILNIMIAILAVRYKWRATIAQQNLEEKKLELETKKIEFETKKLDAEAERMKIENDRLAAEVDIIELNNKKTEKEINNG